MHRVLIASNAEVRLEQARGWLKDHSPTERLLLLGSPAALSRLVHTSLAPGSASFGWQRSSLAALAGNLAQPALARQAKLPVSQLGLEAAACRVIAKLAARGELGDLGRVATRPGLPRAIVRTYSDLRLAKLLPGALPDESRDLRCVLETLDSELHELGLAPSAEVLSLAARALGEPAPGDFYAGVLLLDTRLHNAAEAELVQALAQRAPCLALIPHGDALSERWFARSIASSLEYLEAEGPETSLGRLQTGLFGGAENPPKALDSSVHILSAPGESRECVEIARRILSFASAGVPFERMAVLLRSPRSYASHLSEAFQRAGIPCYLARGLARPDPAGRGLLALLTCRAEGLSASRFAEYLSLGCVPHAARVAEWEGAEDEHGQLPGAPALDPEEPSPDELLQEAGREERDASASMASPRHWERLLSDAAVLGGAQRWERRLKGLSRELELQERGEDSDAARERIERDRHRLRALTEFALPIIVSLSELPQLATWGTWLEALKCLAAQALESPRRVLELLQQLEPMSAVGPVGLEEVRLVLASRLSQLGSPPGGSTAGKVFVASVDDARGLSFDVVFVPGLAEKLFPQKVAEDPLLLDHVRRATSLDLVQNEQRVELERSLLHLATGAASRAVVLSYPRVDLERSRPRVPSFYGLELLRAAEGRLPGFEELAARASEGAEGRMAWPAPSTPELAIDDAEYDLALLETYLDSPDISSRQGAAAYLISANPHLGRALRFRARRWHLRKWKSADGLVEPSAGARTALAEQQLNARAYSATALEQFASCPYRFLLSAIMRLSPRQIATRADQLDPRTRGSLIHEVQERVGTLLRARGWFPLSEPQLGAAIELMRSELSRAAAEYEERLAPAIERVWSDGVRELELDLEGWLHALAEDSEWVPRHFELGFGIDRRGRDAASLHDPVPLACGITLRGAIDSVEQRVSRADPTKFELRATDYKTGRAPEGSRAGGTSTHALVVRGGKTLQPLLYAQALARLFPEQVALEGRLHYCTRRGEYKSFSVPLNAFTNESARLFSDTLGSCLASGFLPAAPERGACDYCDFRGVCGPYEEQRTAKKTEPHPLIERLKRLREEP